MREGETPIVPLGLAALHEICSLHRQQTRISRQTDFSLAQADMLESLTRIQVNLEASQMLFLTNFSKVLLRLGQVQDLEEISLENKEILTHQRTRVASHKTDKLA